MIILNSIFANSITLPALLICLGVGLALGILTSLVFLYRGKHSASFALALALLPMVVSLVILLVNGNIGTGVAVAGAFALVRFRSVPGTAREISAIFVSVAIGLALGLGYVGIAVIFFVIAAAATMILTLTKFGGPNAEEKEVTITVPGDMDYENLFDNVFSDYTTNHELKKVKTAKNGTLYKLTYRAGFADNQVRKDFIDALRAQNNNLSIVVSDPAERKKM